jgi:hypothetical protein
MEDMKFMTLARTSRRFLRHGDINYRIVGIRDGKLILQPTYHSKSYDNPRSLIQLDPKGDLVTRWSMPFASM